MSEVFAYLFGLSTGTAGAVTWAAVATIRRLEAHRTTAPRPQV